MKEGFINDVISVFVVPVEISERESEKFKEDLMPKSHYAHVSWITRFILIAGTAVIQLKFAVGKWTKLRTWICSTFVLNKFFEYINCLNNLRQCQCVKIKLKVNY